VFRLEQPDRGDQVNQGRNPLGHVGGDFLATLA
jgi:hypothetical protein